MGSRYFYIWLSESYKGVFPKLPSRARLFRRLKAPRAWAERFFSEHGILGVIDSYGIELLHPIREGRSDNQIGIR